MYWFWKNKCRAKNFQEKLSIKLESEGVGLWRLVRLWKQPRRWINQKLDIQTLDSWRLKVQKTLQAEAMDVLKLQRVNECHFQWSTMKDKSTTTTSNIPCAYVRSYNCVSIGKEQLIHHRGKVSNSFIHRTLTKSSNKSMVLDQASLTTLMMRWHSSTSLFKLYIKDWILEEYTRLCNISKCHYFVKLYMHQTLRFSYQLSHFWNS